MTPDPQQKVQAEVRQMLARATREQTVRLLQDVLNATPAPKEPVKYDA
ncbi:hypothetical protein [Yoonia sp. F2084L]|nr:hypothetical protein [Yoonia sp. F2084L]